MRCPIMSTPGVTIAWHPQFTCKEHDIWVAHMYTSIILTGKVQYFVWKGDK